MPAPTLKEHPCKVRPTHRRPGRVVARAFSPRSALRPTPLPFGAVRPTQLLGAAIILSLIGAFAAAMAHGLYMLAFDDAWASAHASECVLSDPLGDHCPSEAVKERP